MTELLDPGPQHGCGIVGGVGKAGEGYGEKPRQAGRLKEYSEGLNSWLQNDVGPTVRLGANGVDRGVLLPASVTEADLEWFSKLKLQGLFEASGNGLDEACFGVWYNALRIDPNKGP